MAVCRQDRTYKDYICNHPNISFIHAILLQAMILLGKGTQQKQICWFDNNVCYVGVAVKDHHKHLLNCQNCILECY